MTDLQFALAFVAFVAWYGVGWIGCFLIRFEMLYEQQHGGTSVKPMTPNMLVVFTVGSLLGPALVAGAVCGWVAVLCQRKGGALKRWMATPILRKHRQ